MLLLRLLAMARSRCVHGGRSTACPCCRRMIRSMPPSQARARVDAVRIRLPLRDQDTSPEAVAGYVGRYMALAQPPGPRRTYRVSDARISGRHLVLDLEAP